MFILLVRDIKRPSASRTILDFRYGKDVSKEFIIHKINANSAYMIKSAKEFAKLSKYRQKSCYVCSGKKSKPVSSFYGIRYLMCQKCNHVYAARRITEEQLTNHYSENEDYFTHVYPDKRILPIRKQLFIPKIRFVKKYTKGRNWLDVGSADGTAVSAAISQGFKGEGIEISKPARDFARKYLNLLLSDKPLEVLENETKKRDVISFFGVLEHMPDPVNILKISNRLLNENGIVAIEVPHYSSLTTAIQKLSGEPDRHLVPFTHIMIFTIKSATYLLKKTGFKPIAVWFWGNDVIELLKYIKNQNRKFLNSELYDVLCDKLNNIQHIFDEYKMGDEFFIIGRKIKSV